MLPGSDNVQPLGLRLEVVGWGGGPTEDRIACVFAQRGGKLGRATENDCVLPDTEGVVSRVHAVVRFEDGEYFLIDQSTNGVYLNDSPDRLEAGREYLIHDGDRILIGEFIIEATLVALNERSGPGGLTETGDRLIDMGEPDDSASDPFDVAADALGELPESDGSSKNVRRPDWFPEFEDEAPDTDAAVAQEGQESERAPVPVLAQHMGPAAPAAPAAGGHSAAKSPAPPIGRAEREPSGGGPPTGYVPFGDQFEGFPDGSLMPDSESEEVPSMLLEEESAPTSGPHSAPRSAPIDAGGYDGVQHTTAADPGGIDQSEPAAIPTPTTRPSGTLQGRSGGGGSPPEPAQYSDSQLFEAFLQGLDVSSLQVSPEQAPEFMQQIGGMVRESVQGLIDTLRLRAEFKREFYVPATSIAPVENNLFKYSVNVDDAMARFVSDSGSAYMGPAESTRLAFQDVAAHHLALVAGMEAAVNTLLERFSPDSLRERIGKASLLEGMLPQYRKARMWEEFEKEYQQIAEQAAEDFQEILGQNFSRAYTAQMRRLEQAGFGGKKDDNGQS